MSHETGAAITTASTKRRKGGPKSKTGCRTCKIRRVKCDESKPFCNRCESTGRACDGYPVQVNAGHYPFTLLLDPGEHWAIQQFCQRTAKGIFALSTDSFWERTVPQLAQTEPAIWNAIVALNAMYDLGQTTSMDSQELADTETMESYNRAIRSFLDNFRRKQITQLSIPIPVILCILFVSLEFIRADRRTAFRHVAGGHHMLKDLHHSSPIAVSTRDLVTELRYAFIKLRLQTLVFDPSLLPPAPVQPKLQACYTCDSGKISSFQEASNRAMDIFNETMFALVGLGFFKYREDITLEQIARKNRLEIELLLWRDSFAAFERTNHSIWTVRDFRVAAALKSQWLAFYIYNAASLSRSQTAFDAHLPQFREILDIAEEFITKHMTSSFYFDLGVLPALDFTGAKCRCPVLRRRLLRLLASRHWREGLYDSHRSYRRTLRIMQAEESAVDAVTGFPLERVRVHGSENAPPEFGENVQKMTMVMMPDGPGGDWTLKLEEIPMFGPLPEIDDPPVGVAMERMLHPSSLGTLVELAETSGPLELLSDLIPEKQSTQELGEQSTVPAAI